MEDFYPDGPADVPSDLTRPTQAYKRHAWLAMSMLAVFVVLYVSLATWFVVTAIRLITAGGDDILLNIFIGLCSGFLAVFMIKALFFVKRGGDYDGLEITEAEQPRLFDFLNRLADEAGAPRPHRVYLSARVNAAVFYDLTILNLIFPSRKNLEIGLSLVNCLNLSELKAVCAHEFGHFAQRTMAVGRWVYIAQQIAGHIVAKRDGLDKMLDAISTFDIRVAWIGWLMRLIVWSIRSLLDTAFGVVVLAERALSREMEMQADLVSVSLAGSDGIVAALHRLSAADDAWSRTLDFVNSELGQKRMPIDVFAIQQRIIERMAILHGDAEYGRSPVRSQEDPAAHRVFEAGLAQPPRMWMTHPLNHEREENAKRQYVSAPIDARSAWDVFDNAEALREKLSARLRPEGEFTTTSTEETLVTLDALFGREYLASAYRGLYWSHSCVRWAEDASLLHAEVPVTSIARSFETLYPERLVADLELVSELSQQKAMLEAVRRGQMQMPGGVVRHRGRDIRKKDIPRVVAGLGKEIEEVNARLEDHDRQCRGAHRAAAALIGGAWRDYLDAVLRILHFAEHMQADLLDLHGVLKNVLAIETSTRRVSRKGVDRLQSAASDLQAAFLRLDAYADHTGSGSFNGVLVLNDALLKRLSTESWSALAGRHELSAPSGENLGKWLDVVDSWVGHWSGVLGKLKLAALDELLVSERHVREAFISKTDPGVAPECPKAPQQYPVMKIGRERPRQMQLDWWKKFQAADGWLASCARFLVAGGIVGSVLGFSANIGSASLQIYNGLDMSVAIEVNGETHQISAFSGANITLNPGDRVHVNTKDSYGQTIESFTESPLGMSGKHVYNVAAASPLLVWTAVYGKLPPQKDQELGAQRWLDVHADILFSEPPQSISTRQGDGGYRVVLSGLGDRAASEVFSHVEDAKQRETLIRTRASFDSPHGQHVLEWLDAAESLPDAGSIIGARLKRDPYDIVALRAEQDLAKGAAHDAVCSRHQGLAEKKPGDGNLRYLVDRCITDREESTSRILADFARYPESPWLAYLAGHRLASARRWPEAQAALEMAFNKEPALSQTVALDIARIRRVIAGNEHPPMSELLLHSVFLSRIDALENKQVDLGNVGDAYVALQKGELDKALNLTRGSPVEARFVRFVGASDGANLLQQSEALSLGMQQGLDGDTYWPSLALAMRQGVDLAPWMAILDQQANAESAKAMRAILDALRVRDLTGFDREFVALDAEMQGKAFVVGSVYLGRAAPAGWRRAARLLLFTPERPYLSER